MATTAKKNNPLELLRSLEKRSLEYAKGLPQQEEIKGTSLVIGFCVGDMRLVTPVDEVTELLTYPEMSRVPGTKSWVRGIANVRGSLLPIIDLKDYLMRETTELSVQSRVLVVNHEGVLAGLLVDEVLGLKHFKDDDYSHKLPDADNFLKSYMTGAYKQDSEEWGVFSMHALAKSPLFLQIAV